MHQNNHLSTRPIIYAAIVLLLLAFSAFAINFFYYRYPGNNYFPIHTPFIALSLLLMYLGSILQFGHTSKLAARLKEVIIFFIIMSLLAIATNAVQFTPFPTIDQKILSYETSHHIDSTGIMLWTNNRPLLKELLEFIYDTLPYQMSYLPLLIIAAGQFHYVREYYFLLLLTAIIGFTFYYFFPTTAPASIIASPLFSEAQRATGLKFMQIHHYLQPTTLQGGMIALPSFHTIWAWGCLLLLRGYPILFMLMLPVNLLLIASCVLLGWHYPFDLLGSVIVIVLAHSMFYYSQKKRLTNLRFKQSIDSLAAAKLFL